MAIRSGSSEEAKTILAGTLKNVFTLLLAERKTQQARQLDQLRALRRLIGHASENIPMYREMYAENGNISIESLDHLQQLPVVSKRVLRMNFPDRTTDPRLGTEHLYQIATSGTSDRVMLFHDEAKRDWDRAADILLKLRGSGWGSVLTVPPDDCYERCGMNDTVPTPLTATLMDAMALNAKTRQGARREAVSRLANRFLWNEHVSPAPGVNGTAVEDSVIDRYFDDVRQLEPRTMKAFPWYYWMLAKRASGRTLSPVEVVRPSGGKATPHMIDVIERTLDVTFRENYGTAELGTVSMDADTSRAQTLLEHLFVIEFVRHGKPAENGEIGEMVVTDLRNFASPLIRYAVGDVGRVVTGSTDGHQLQFEVCGRLDETIVTPDGRVFTPDEVTDFFLTLPGIDYFRLVQRTDNHFLLEVVRGEVEIDSVAIEQSFAAFIGYNVSLQTRPVRRIAPESSGKYKLIQSSSYDRFHSQGAQRDAIAGLAPR